MENEQTSFYENTEPNLPRGFGDLREKNVNKNISLMVREEGDGSEDVSVRCRSETNSNLTEGEEGYLYSVADREENTAELVYSSYKGWVYVNSNHKKPLDKLHKDVVSAKGDSLDRQSVTDNNNKKNIAFFDIRSQRRENKANIHSEILHDSETRKPKAKGKINLRVMPVNVEIPAEVNTEKISHNESQLNTKYGRSGSQFEREISYINMANMTLENESIYIDMNNESSFDDAYVDMHPIFPTADIPSDSEILKGEMSASNVTSFNVDMVEEKVSYSGDSGLKENLDCTGQASNVNGKTLPNKPQPTPRTLLRSTGQNFQSKPCPVPRVRPNKSQPYLHDSQSVLKDGLVNEAGRDRHDANHNHNPALCDIKSPADNASQFQESFDENQSISTTINVENVKQSPSPIHLLQNQYNRGNFLETVVSKDHSATVPQDGEENLPPLSTNSLRNSMKTSLSVNSSADHAKEDKSPVILPRELNAHSQEYDAFGYLKVYNDDPGKHCNEEDTPSKSLCSRRSPKQGLPTSNHQAGESIDNISFSQSLPPPVPAKEWRSTIIKQSQLDKDKNDIPPKLVPRKSAQIRKSHTTPRSSQYRGCEERVKSEENPDRKALKDEKKPPRPPKTFLQQGNGASNCKPLTSSNYVDQSAFSETGMESKFSSSSNGIGVAGVISDHSSTTKKFGYGFHLSDGPWYACRDVTRMSSTDGKQSDLDYDYAYDWFEQPKVSSATSTKSEEAKENAGDLNQIESDFLNIKDTETEDAYEYVEDWGEQHKAPIKITKKQQKVSIKRTEEGYEDVEDWGEKQKAPIKRTEEVYEDVEDWEERQREPMKSQKEKPSRNQLPSYAFSDELSGTQNEFEVCETRKAQVDSEMTLSSTNEIGAAAFKTTDKRKLDTRKTKHKIQEKKSEKSSTPKKMPDNYVDFAEKVIKQIEKSSENRNEDFEDFELIQLYLVAKESLRN